MTTTTIPLRDVELDLACEMLYRYLNAALGDPRSERWQVLRDPDFEQLALDAADVLREEFAALLIPLGFGEAPAEELDLRSAIDIFKQRPMDVANDFLRIFGLVHCRECPPYESEFHPNEDTFFRSQQMADVAGFYRAFGLVPDPHERPDHLCLELEFAALLLTKKRAALAVDDHERSTVCQDALAAFFADHMSWWMPSFALALRTKADGGFYEAAGRVLAALLPLQRNRLGIAPPRIPLQAGLSEDPDPCTGCSNASGG